MSKIIAILFVGLMIAQQASAEGIRIRMTDRYGYPVVHELNIKEAQPTAPARVYEVNKFGQTQYHKPHLKVEGNKVYQINKFGQTQYHKPHFVIEKSSK